jgi:carbamoyltransferase
MTAAKDPWVLGISASHNGSACLLHGDEIVVAVQEERLTRVKRQRIRGAEECLSIPYCLATAGIGARDLDAVVVSSQTGNWTQANNIARNPQLKDCVGHALIDRIPHHFGHAVSAFATSGFSDAAVLVIDGMGGPAMDLMPAEQDVVVGRPDDGWESVSLYAAEGTCLKPVEKHLVPRGEWLETGSIGMPVYGSIGGMYSAAAVQIFGDDMDAGKVMGLAPYGNPVIPKEDFIAYDGRSFTFPNIVQARFRDSERWPNRQRDHEDLAASVQAALEDVVLHFLQCARTKTTASRLCLAGGVALNSVLNERVIRESGFREVFIVPAAEDSGVAIGAAYHGLWALTHTNTRRQLRRDSLGRSYAVADVALAGREFPALREIQTADPIALVVDLLAGGKTVGWFRDGSELGPRALGQRSILCDARRPDAKEILNARVKKREAFRPFAPVLPLEDASTYFELDGVDASSPFMLRVCRFQPDKRDMLPAVVHVDGTGRLQTLTEAENPALTTLVKHFGQQTGVPVLLNTSFNEAGEPIVETPRDALACLQQSGLDACAFGDRVFVKT